MLLAGAGVGVETTPTPPPRWCLARSTTTLCRDPITCFTYRKHVWCRAIFATGCHRLLRSWYVELKSCCTTVGMEWNRIIVAIIMLEYRRECMTQTTAKCNYWYHSRPPKTGLVVNFIMAFFQPCKLTHGVIEGRFNINFTHQIREAVSRKLHSDTFGTNPSNRPLSETTSLRSVCPLLAITHSTRDFGFVNVLIYSIIKPMNAWYLKGHL